jgi:dTDP-4-amino-4,6-dideoxygalactose transaminase
MPVPLLDLPVPLLDLPVPLLDLKAQYAGIRDEVRAAIDRVCDSQHFILGPEVEAFEREVAEYSQCKFAVGVSSGTDALLAGLMAIDLKPGDEVITTPYSFFATAGSVARLGGRCVYVDIDPLTFNIDATQLEAAITERTRAIIPVHLYGQMAEMDPLMEIADRHKLFVIEDAAQAIGAEHKGKRAGSIGHLGSFSFYPSKNLGGFGDGGMVTTNDSGLAERVKLLRNHGYSQKYYNIVVGGNFRLDAIQAAVLRVKLKYLDSWTGARQRNAAIYRELFTEAELDIRPAALRPLSSISSENGSEMSNLKGVVLPAEADGSRHIYNQFVIRCDRRDALMEFLRAREIGTEIYYPVPLHLQECFAAEGHQVGDFPISESAAKETLALPIYPELTREMLHTVVETIADFYHGESES